MHLSRKELPESLKQQYKQYCYKVIYCMQFVHNKLGPALPEYIYQEALTRKLIKEGFDVIREYQHHPQFDGEPLSSFIKMDILVRSSEGNIIIECKSIAGISDREQLQTFGYLCGTEFPYAIIVNFGTYPKAQIERYHYDAADQSICAF